jgi:hypothetical protein
MLPDLAGAAQLVSIWQFSCWYTALMSSGMTLIRANTLAFGLIGKDGPHRIIKICFGNMNLAFGSEVALLGFWEYMFGILVTVWFNPVWKGSSWRVLLSEASYNLDPFLARREIIPKFVSEYGYVLLPGKMSYTFL